MKRISLLAVFFALIFSSALLAAEDSNHPQLENSGNYWCTFVDAIGEPIPHAKIQIFRTNKEGEEVLAKETSLDERGNLKKRPVNPDQRTFVVSHRDYGIAQAAKHYEGQGFDNFVYYVPLVRRDSEDYNYSIRGVVLDPNNRPVAGAKITCWSATTPSGVKLRGPSATHAVRTSEEGRFAMHLPIVPSAKVYVIPLRSIYKVKIDPPKGLGLIPYRGRITSGQDSAIVLDSADYFRTFVFEDANGPITDLEKLKVIHVCVRLANNMPWYIRYPEWKDGTLLPLGTFEAGMYSERTIPFEILEFEPIEVTAESPEQLVFKAGQKASDKDMFYIGQVVSGITGEPMPGAFVAAANYANGDFSLITPEQWQKLHELEPRSSVNEAAPEPLRKIRPFKHIARTDIAGRFEMTINTSQPFEYITAFEQDYLAVKYDTEREKIFTPDENNVIRLPIIRLYPAAKVIIEPYVDINEPIHEILTAWKLGENNHLGWFDDFCRYYQSAAQFIVNYHFRPQETNSMHIPAGMDIQIRIFVVQPRRYGGMFWCPILTDTIRARQGETVDLGRITLEQEMPIFVQVVDSDGNPIEGVGVTHYGPDRKHYHDQKHLTDPEGIAEFYVPPYYKGRFVVGYRDENKKDVTESITYETNGLEDANSVFTLRVPDEMLYRLFK